MCKNAGDPTVQHQAQPRCAISAVFVCVCFRSGSAVCRGSAPEARSHQRPPNHDAARRSEDKPAADSQYCLWGAVLPTRGLAALDSASMTPKSLERGHGVSGENMQCLQ